MPPSLAQHVASIYHGQTDRIVQRTVIVGIGGNKGIGGINETQFGHEETLRKPTLEVDGYKLFDQGKIQT